MKILRLTFPQWQGADPAIMPELVPELSQQAAAQGYYLGSQLLDWLAPKTQTLQASVPVSLDYADENLSLEKGIYAYQILNRQLQAALDTLVIYQPDKIVTLGGECSVSVAPFSYLAEKYQGDVAVVWIDAHPDLTRPHEGYLGYYAMALATLCGQGDQQLINKLPAKINPQNAVIVGFRSEVPGDLERLADFGVHHISAQEANLSSESVLKFLRQRGKRNILVHLDLDGLDPQDLRMAVAADPQGLKVNTVIRLIQDIAQHYHLLGLTIAEPMPREVIKLRYLLHNLPLLAD
ncbi:arginase [Mesocricetibacter intestinalis]|uniref:Arginase n=1 Tax=Mesocricetibacter intestinalis TaxID=1521930 RepID=A0A4R6VBW2_9PAST|nr:arginase family protein [Mesocricetibacter intestinalis]TDQ57440.1 arginase [Mesocricetibacter intestinalis]